MALQVRAPPRQIQGGGKSIDGYARVTSVTRQGVTSNSLARLTCDLQGIPGGGNDKLFAEFLQKHITNSGVNGDPIYVCRDHGKNVITVAGKAFAFQNNQIYKLTLTIDPNIIIGKYVVTAAAKK